MYALYYEILQGNKNAKLNCVNNGSTR